MSSENSGFAVDDFISLSAVARKLAKNNDDDPDKYITLAQCAKKRVRVAVWRDLRVKVWRYEKPVEPYGKYPIMGKGDYICDWRGAFFLVDDWIAALLNSREKSISCGEFSTDGSLFFDDLFDPVTIASSRDLGRRGYEEYSQELIKEHGVASIDKLPSIYKVLLKDMYESAESSPSDDGFLEFSIDAVKVLREDLPKLGITQSKHPTGKKGGSPPQPKPWTPREHGLDDIFSVLEPDESRWKKKVVSKGARAKYIRWQHDVCKSDEKTHKQVCQEIAKNETDGWKTIRAQTYSQRAIDKAKKAQ